MRSLRAMLHRWSGFFRRRALEAEMRAEMQAHLDALTERNVSAGMSREDARYAALREFGGVAQIEERARDERRSIWAEQLWQDLGYAIRGLARSPTFTITAVVTLALGIGVNAALFNVYNMVALRPLPVKDPDSLVRIAGRNSRGGNDRIFSYAEYVAYRDGTSALSEIFAFGETRWSLQTGPGAERDAGIEGVGGGKVSVEFVSENYFGGLGAPMELGRAFRPEEVRTPGSAPVIVLSHLFWQRHFHGDPDVIGTTLTLNHQVVTVIGVTAREFSGQVPVPPAGWLPLTFASSQPEDYGPNGPRRLKLIGRLAPSVTEAQAKAELDTIASRRAAEFPGEGVKTSVWLERGLHFISFNRSPQGVAALGSLFFGFGLVLLIACTNVANLLLARGISRQSEIGVRLTLGASRGRIVRQLLTENLLLCAIGSALGLGLGIWTLQMLLPVVVGQLPVDWALETRRLPFFDTTPDPLVFGFTALLTVGATLVAGLLPALHGADTNLISTVRNDGTAFSGRFPPSKVRRVLVISQVAVSLMLLSCAGVFARNCLAMRNLDVGFDAHAVFGVGVVPNPSIADRTAAFRQALDTVRAIPGVAATAVANRPPLHGSRVRPRIRTADATGAEDEVHASFVTRGFFDTFGIPLLRGRDFAVLEQHSASHAIVISDSLARRLWPAQEAVGKVIAVSESAWSSREQPAPAEAFRDCEVVGVARDVMMLEMVQMRQDDRRFIYLPFPLETSSGGPVFVRPRSDSHAALAEIVRAAEAGGVELEFWNRHSHWVDQVVFALYGLSILSGVLGALALIMASVGLYGLMMFAASQRVREIGIRMALGATAKNVVRLFVRQGMRLVAIGLAFGLIGGGLFALVLEKVFFGMIKAFDPVAFGVVTLLFGVIALFACWLPARRATKVDPMVALRAE